MDKIQKSAQRIYEERLAYADQNISKGKLTQDGLAQKIPTTQQQINYLEKGARKLSPEMAFRMAEVFGVRAEYLLGRDDFRTDRDLVAHYTGESVNYHNNLDACFFAFLDALEIDASAVFHDTLIKTTTVTVDTQMHEISEPEMSVQQEITYTIKSPGGVKSVSETDFLKYKDLVCKYAIFLADQL